MPQLQTKGRGRERGRFGKEGSKQEPGKEMLARVVAMLTRLIDRFDADDTPQSRVLAPSSASPIVIVLVLDFFAHEQMNPWEKGCVSRSYGGIPHWYSRLRPATRA